MTKGIDLTDMMIICIVLWIVYFAVSKDVKRKIKRR